MDRILCVTLCVVVILVSVYLLGYCNAVENAPEYELPIYVKEPSVVVTQPSEPVVAESEPTEATEPIVETEPPVTLYDVPLSEDLQLHIIQLCDSYQVDPAIVMAVIFRESTFNPDCVGDSGYSLGLMQIQERWHYERMERLSCSDLLNPYHNVSVGIDYLAEMLGKYDGDIGMALTAYNAGPTGAYNYYFSKGVYASKYAREVMAYADEIR